MDDYIKHKVVYLLTQGWTDFEKIQQSLEISDDDWKQIMSWLIEEGMIVLHTIH